MIRVANKNCQKFADKCQSFEGSNLMGKWVSSSTYVVYSYGWWPIYAKIDGVWYGHNEKYSRSTGRHQSQARPYGDITWLETVDQLIEKIDTKYGFAEDLFKVFKPVE